MVYTIPPTDRPTVSIIIPLYGGKEHLDSCLRSLLLNTDAAFELIFVDNNSPDDTVDWIAKMLKVPK